MLRSKNYILFLILEILTVPLVITLFKTVESKKVAAALAGLLFVSLGCFVYYSSFRSKKSLTLYAAAAHLFLFSIPMFAKRLFFWGSSFDQITFYGLKGPAFHKLSETAFLILFAASVIDLARLKLSSKSKID